MACCVPKGNGCPGPSVARVGQGSRSPRGSGGPPPHPRARRLGGIAIVFAIGAGSRGLDNENGSRVGAWQEGWRHQVRPGVTQITAARRMMQYTDSRRLICTACGVAMALGSRRGATHKGVVILGGRKSRLATVFAARQKVRGWEYSPSRFCCIKACEESVMDGGIGAQSSLPPDTDVVVGGSISCLIKEAPRESRRTVLSQESS